MKQQTKFMRLGCILLFALFVNELLSMKAFWTSLHQTPTSPLLEKNQAHQLDLKALTIKTPLFGQYVPKDIAGPGVETSNLNVTVVGIMFSDEEAQSQVLIRLGDGYDHLYKVGDKLPNGGVIKRITEEGILVFRQGAMERLVLPKDDLNFEPNASLLEENDSDVY